MNHANLRIEHALAMDMVRSERHRALLLLGLFALLAVASTTFSLARDDALVSLTGNEGFRDLAPFLLSLILSFEALMALYFNQLLRTERVPPPWVLVVATVVETSLPTLMLALLTGFLSPLDVLGAPPLLYYFLLIALSPLRMQVHLCLLTGVVAAVGYLGVALPHVEDIAVLAPSSIFARWQPHVAKAAVMLICGGLTAFVTLSIRKRQQHALELMGERQRVVDVFGQHVSPAVVDRLLDQDTDQSSEVRRVCMMFLDIRSFTAFSENRTPADVVDFLNQLFEPLVDLVDQHHGIINKFLGDGFMAVFGAPMDDAQAELNATRAALAMLDKADELRQTQVIPKLGIGLHAGLAMTGNVGSRRRKEYTLIGDTVNLASRIESLNKQFDAQLLVSDTV